MHPARRVRLEETMCRLGAGDPAFVWSLIEDFGGDLAGVARSIIVSSGRRDVLADPGRVEGMVIDIALHLFAVSGAWDPAKGALPWVWARRAIERIVWADLGHRSVEVDDALLDPAPMTGAGGSALSDATLAGLGDADARVARLVEAIGRVGTARDAAVHTEYRIQAACGDPSPANTVAAELGLRAANVRQIDVRMRRKLRALAASDPDFVELGNLRWLA